MIKRDCGGVKASKNAGRSELLNSLLLKVSRGTLTGKEAEQYKKLVCNESVSEEEAGSAIRKMADLGLVDLRKR